jgi:hypothetical protein
VPTQRWLVTDAQYATIRRTQPIAAASQPEPVRPAPVLQITANGPAAHHLLGLLTKAGIGSMLPASHSAPTLEDHNAGASAIIGEVTYVFADGSLVSASQQQLVRPLPYSVVGLVGAAEPLQWSTGTLVVFNYRASFI